MILKTLAVGDLHANCYILGCEQTKKGAVIDPGGSGEYIVQTIKEMGLEIQYIINTHGHIDHIASNGIVQKATGAPILIHTLDNPMLTDANLNLASFLGLDFQGKEAEQKLEDGNIIEFGTIKIEVIHTPGHTKGCICLKAEKEIFTGDTLFAGSVGRTDMPGGNMDALLKSIQEKLLCYENNLIIYPGHGPSSTIGAERRSNPFL